MHQLYAVAPPWLWALSCLRNRSSFRRGEELQPRQWPHALNDESQSYTSSLLFTSTRHRTHHRTSNAPSDDRVAEQDRKRNWSREPTQSANPSSCTRYARISLTRPKLKCPGIPSKVSSPIATRSTVPGHRFEKDVFKGVFLWTLVFFLLIWQASLARFRHVFKDKYEIQAKSFGGLKMEDMKMISMISFSGLHFR